MFAAAAKITDIDNPATNFADPATWSISGILSGGTGSLNLINLLFFLVGLAFFANLAIAAFSYISSEGDPAKISKANSRITMGVVGLVIAFASFVIIRLVAALFGFDASIPIN